MFYEGLLDVFVLTCGDFVDYWARLVGVSR